MDFKTIKDEIIKHPEGGKMLSAAFTHRSFASENNLDYDNQRLEVHIFSLSIRMQKREL